jgi:hypothetical protein
VAVGHETLCALSSNKNANDSKQKSTWITVLNAQIFLAKS